MEKNNAKFNRNAIRWLVAFAALGGFQVVQAGYATLPAPAGFAGSGANMTYAATSGDSVFGSLIRQKSTIGATLAGSEHRISTAARLSSAAPRVAALVVMQHPAVRLAVGAVGVVSWLASAKLVYDVATGTWRESADPSSGDVWYWTGPETGMQEFSSGMAACTAAMGKWGTTSGISYSMTGTVGNPVTSCSYNVLYNGNQINTGSYSVTPRKRTVEGCPNGWNQSPAGCLSPILSEPQFIEKLASKPMPQTVPLELPSPTPLPIDYPPLINPSPGDNPQSQTLRSPTGAPVPIPNTNPQQYRQPYIDLIPSPTTDNPWRVDIKPGEVTSTDPNPVTNPQPDPNADDKPTPEEDKSLCEKHPDILACSKPELDTPNVDIPKATKTITYQVEDAFGGGSCPVDVYTNIGGKNVRVYEWSRTCSVVITYLRPIILLLGAMGALFILSPGRDS